MKLDEMNARLCSTNCIATRLTTDAPILTAVQLRTMITINTKKTNWKPHARSRTHLSESGRTATGSDRNGNEAAASAASEAFARWLHHLYAPIELPSAKTYPSARDTLFGYRCTSRDVTYFSVIIAFLASEWSAPARPRAKAL